MSEQVDPQLREVCKNLLMDLRREVSDRDNVIAAVESLQAKITAMQSRTYCAYCGESFPLDDGTDHILAHIAACPKHPIADYRAEVARLRTALATAERARDEARELWGQVAVSGSRGMQAAAWSLVWQWLRMHGLDDADDQFLGKCGIDVALAYLSEVFAQRDAARADVARLEAERDRLAEEAAWVRRKLGLAEDTPANSGDGPTLYGKMHVVCSEAYGYDTYVKAYKCNDKQGEIARLSVAVGELTAQRDAARDALATAEAERAAILAASVIEGDDWRIPGEKRPIWFTAGCGGFPSREAATRDVLQRAGIADGKEPTP